MEFKLKINMPKYGLGSRVAGKRMRHGDIEPFLGTICEITVDICAEAMASPDYYIADLDDGIKEHEIHIIEYFNTEIVLQKPKLLFKCGDVVEYIYLDNKEKEVSRIKEAYKIIWSNNKKDPEKAYIRYTVEAPHIDWLEEEDIYAKYKIKEEYK